MKSAKNKLPLLIGLGGCLGLVLLVGVASAISFGFIFNRAKSEKPVADMELPRESQKEKSSTSSQPAISAHPRTAIASNPQPKDGLSQEPPVKVSVRVLEADYRMDLVAADLKFLDKTIELSEVDGKVEREEQGRYFIGTGVRRLVKTQNSGPQTRSLSGARHALQQSILNAKYVPGVILYIGSADLKNFTGLDGTKKITIRGRCKGSQKDPSTIPEHYIIVEECVFVEMISVKPQPAPTPKATRVRQQPVPPPKFSETDVEASASWLISEIAKANSSLGNAIATKQKHDALKKTIDDLKGRRIAWIMPVGLIGQKTITFRRIGASGAVLIVHAADSGASMPRRGAPRRASPKGRIPVPKGAPGPEAFRHSGDEWIGNLMLGSKVKLSGVIDQVNYHSYMMIITIKDYTISPPD